MSDNVLNNILKEPATSYAATGSRLDLVTLSRKGIRKQALLNLTELLDLNLKDMAGLLPVTERTLQRRGPLDLLPPAVSEQVILLAELTQKGVDVLGSTATFRKWLLEGNTGLAGHPPLQLLDTSIGIQLVTDELGRLAYGVYS